MSNPEGALSDHEIIDRKAEKFLEEDGFRKMLKTKEAVREIWNGAGAIMQQDYTDVLHDSSKMPDPVTTMAEVNKALEYIAKFETEHGLTTLDPLKESLQSMNKSILEKNYPLFAQTQNHLVGLRAGMEAALSVFTN